MKIVFLAPGTGSYHCGVCMRDNAVAREMIRQGHEAIVLPMYLPLTLDEQPASSGLPVFYGGIRVYLQQKFSFFRHTPAWVDRLLNSRPLLRLAGKRAGMTGGAEVGDLTVSMLRGEQGNQAKELEEVLTWLRLERPDSVWLSTALLVGLARTITRELGIPVFCSLQGEDSFLDELNEPERTEAWQTLAERSRDIHRFISPSLYYTKLMGRRMSLPPEQMVTIPNGIDLRGYAPAEPLQPPTLGFLARLIAGKGLGIVVSAFIELHKRGRFPQSRLRCIGAMTGGDEKYVERLRAQLQAAGVEALVEFRPNVSREQKVESLRGLTLLSTPAHYGEAFGLYLIEAMAAGVPVVQPRMAAFPEIVQATGGGILFDELTPGCLADAWETLLSDPAKCQALGRAGRAAVERDFTIEKLTSRLLALAEAARNPEVLVTASDVSPLPTHAF